MTSERNPARDAAAVEDSTKDAVISARNIKRYYRLSRSGLFGKAQVVRAVDGVDFDIRKGETLALVGESGCGKSTTARMVLQLETPTSGALTYRGADLHKLGKRAQNEYRRNVQAVFQDPYGSFNPRIHIGKSVSEPLREAEPALSRAQVEERTIEALAAVGLPARFANHYPHQMSGGQRQRAAIARAIITRPECIVLDEAVSSLDVSVRGQVVNLLADLQEERGISYLFIAHDLPLVRAISTTVGVMYLGRMVESAPSEELYERPLHPYTQTLLSNVLPDHPNARREPVLLKGEPPSPLNVPTGCPFHTRCPRAMDICSRVSPPAITAATKHTVSCHLFT